MKHFALVNDKNIVINISVANASWDSKGWIEYTGKNCGIGYTYDKERDAFIPPKPEGNFVLNEETYLWEEVIE